jgi:hypothetical protein
VELANYTKKAVEERGEFLKFWNTYEMGGGGRGEGGEGRVRLRKRIGCLKEAPRNQLGGGGKGRGGGMFWETAFKFKAGSFAEDGELELENFREEDG